ncbi:MAG: hypothetical protein JRJ85_13990 [Deltaproteobacteria bacterium]|nr:hypothetical protein [Deltaproteobacteria bacterium]
MAVVKKIGRSGQITLGKEYAGRDVIVEKVEEGVWVIKTGRFIPDSEKWLHQPEVSKSIDEAVSWAEDHPPRKTDLDHLEEQLHKS